MRILYSHSDSETQPVILLVRKTKTTFLVLSSAAFLSYFLMCPRYKLRRASRACGPHFVAVLGPPTCATLRYKYRNQCTTAAQHRFSGGTDYAPRPQHLISACDGNRLKVRYEAGRPPRPQSIMLPGEPTPSLSRTTPGHFTSLREAGSTQLNLSQLQDQQNLCLARFGRLRVQPSGYKRQPIAPRAFLVFSEATEHNYITVSET